LKKSLLSLYAKHPGGLVVKIGPSAFEAVIPTAFPAAKHSSLVRIKSWPLLEQKPLAPNFTGVNRTVELLQHEPPLHVSLGHMASFAHTSPTEAKHILARHGPAPSPQSSSASHASPAAQPPSPQQTPFPHAPDTHWASALHASPLPHSAASQHTPKPQVPE
jgi:hypothetical protein